MHRSILTFYVALGQLCAVQLASAQVPEAPSSACLEDLNDARAWANQSLSCGFDRASLTYAGSPVEQARCLLRRVQPGGTPVDQAGPLPDYLEALVGRPVSVSARQVSEYLRANGIAPSDIGGNLSSPISRNADGAPALYFVIHDTSYPGYGPRRFGPEIDQPNSDVNLISRHRDNPNAKAHIFISRIGASVTGHDYSVPWRATRTERCVVGPTSRGRFLHHELIQPRRTSGRRYRNDQPPDIAITPAQIERLAITYVAASVRAGRWLIPAYHATVDEDLPGGHDDPQGFDLAVWTEALERTVTAIGRINAR